jgi:hypothetical protein
MKKRKLQFWSADAATGGGVSAASDVFGGSSTGADVSGDNGAATGAPTEPATSVEPASPQTPQTPPQTTTTDGGFTPDKIRELIQTAAQAGAQVAGQQPAAQPQQTLTPEEIDRATNAFRPTQDHIAALLEGGENSVKAMQQIVEGAVKHATTISWLQSQMIQRQMQERIDPVMNYYSEVQTEKLRNSFFEQFPDLKQHTKLLAAVKASLDQEGAFNDRNTQDGFNLIASRAKEVLAATGAGNANGGGGAAPAAQNPPSQMASLSRGSQHGAAAAGAGGSASPATAKVIFG